MRENIEAAVEEVVTRLEGTPFANHGIRAMKTPIPTVGLLHLNWSRK
jgi:hypothetical protein